MSRPRLLFVNQHYWPDVAATGQILTDLAERCAARGFDVEVLTGKAKYVSGGLDAPARETRNGVRIRRLATTSFGRGSKVGRLADYAGFYLGVLRSLLTGPPADLAVVLTTPPLLGYAASIAKRVRGQRYAVWSMDLHPEAEIAAGMLREDSLPARRLHAFNDTGYRHADLVVALGFRMKERIAARGIDAAKLVTIGVWSDGRDVTPVPRASNPVRQELGIRDDQVVVMYSGNAGLAHRFDEVLEAMRRLRDDDRFVFLFVGSGPRRSSIEAFIAEHGLANARYHDYFPREQLAASLSTGDIHLLTLQEEMAGIAVPSKLYGVMAAARPIVMVGPARSEPGRTIQEHDLGAVVDPLAGGTAQDLVDALVRLAEDPEARAAIGARARDVFEAEFDRPILTERWVRLLADHLGADLSDADAPAPTADAHA